MSTLIHSDPGNREPGFFWRVRLLAGCLVREKSA